MAVILNASTSSGLVQTADTSGNLELQSNGSTKLTVNSTGVVATNLQGCIVQGTEVASTSGTSIDFTGIPTWAKRITVNMNGVSTSGTSSILIQLGDSGGIETSGYTAICSNGSSVVDSTAGFIIRVTANTNTFYGSMPISTIGSNVWVQAGGFLSNTSSEVRSTAGGKTLSSVLTQIRITTANGTDTFDAGSINIQYEG